MAKYVGSWWIKDGIDGRRLEAEGFASTLGGLAEFDWTQNHGESDVKQSDFVTTTNVTQRSDTVDAMQMSSHGWTDGFLVWGGDVTTSEAVDFGKNDLEEFFVPVNQEYFNSDGTRNTLSFVCPNAVKPSEVGAGPDQRTLSFAFITLSLRESSK